MRNLSLEEKRRHSSQLVPFSYYKCLIPDYFPNVPLHCHSETEINYIISGGSEIVCGDRRYITKKGDIVIIPPDKLHAIYPVADQKQFYDTIVFSMDMLGSSENDRSCAEFIRPLLNGSMDITPVITSDHSYYSELKTAVENIFSCAKGNSSSLDILMKSELFRLFWLLVESGDIFEVKGDNAKKSELLRPAIEYMNENYQDNITITVLAEQVCMSKSYFMRRFREITGTGAIEYLSQLRIKKACELMVSTDISVSDAAFESGYRNLSNFNRQFRQLVGCSPREYKALQKQSM